MSGDIAIDTVDGVATLRLRNPARRNAISTAMWDQLGAFGTQVSAQQDVRLVVIRGDGDKAFSAGADVTGFDSARSGTGNAPAYDDLVENTCRLVEAIAQPTLAVIVGACMGAGASLAASCDLRIAADDAFFAVPAARLGLGYDPRGIKRCLRVFGTEATREMLYTAERLPARRAAELGVVSAVLPAKDIDRVAAEWITRIAANAPLTIKAAKMAIRAHLADDAKLLAEAEKLYAAADASADYAEGRRAFAEKRPPRFTGK
jgi:enoyl-CoA hydratase/carnithine racemase